MNDDDTMQALTMPTFQHGSWWWPRAQKRCSHDQQTSDLTFDSLTTATWTQSTGQKKGERQTHCTVHTHLERETERECDRCTERQDMTLSSTDITSVARRASRARQWVAVIKATCQVPSASWDSQKLIGQLFTRCSEEPISHFTNSIQHKNPP